MMIDTSGLSKRFGSTQALADLNLHVPEGSVFALIGPNGAGKTTALRILLNIVRPGGGRAEILGTDSRHIGPKELARIGYVSENRELPEWMTVSEYFNYCRPFYPEWQDSEAAELARMFDFPVDRTLRALSRGMRMKAALAGTLAYRPKLLIMDEPFSGLDVVVREQLLECIAERTPECTVLIATHDLSDIESFATHVAYLSDGHLLFAEEMETLTKRFREIEMVLSGDTSPQILPDNWMNLKQAPGVIRFTDADYQPAKCEAEIRQRWSGIKDITVRALTLRSIFIALAANRKATR